MPLLFVKTFRTLRERASITFLILRIVEGVSTIGENDSQLKLCGAVGSHENLNQYRNTLSLHYCPAGGSSPPQIEIF